MNTLKILSAFITSILIVWGCTTNVAGPENNGDLPRELNANEQELVEKSRSFSFDVFKATVAAEDQPNVFISPLSISIALGMTMNGADGETFEQMRNVLDFAGLDQQQINEGYQSLVSLLLEADPKVRMQIANSVWTDQNYTVQENFKQTLNEYFEARATELDFQSPESVEMINDWVEEQTNGLIEKIIEGNIPPEMVMYLINAIYFKGDWTYQFDEEKTQEAMFQVENGEPVEVDMMNQKNEFNVLMNDQVHMIDLPYGDSLYTMTVILPGDENQPLDEFIQQVLTEEKVVSWYKQVASGYTA